MPRFLDRARVNLALVVASTFFLGAASAPALPPSVAADVHESYRLLTASAYRPVDPQALLAAAGDALAEAARKRGVTLAPPALRVESGNDATLAELDDAIASAAAAAHAAPTDFAYAAIAAMAKRSATATRSFSRRTSSSSSTTRWIPSESAESASWSSRSGFSEIRLSYVVPERRRTARGCDRRLLTAIGPTATKGMSVEAASKLLRGKAGTTVEPYRIPEPALRKRRTRSSVRKSSRQRSFRRCCPGRSATST